MTCARVTIVVELARRLRIVRRDGVGGRWSTLAVSDAESAAAHALGGWACAATSGACDAAFGGRCAGLVS